MAQMVKKKSACNARDLGRRPRSTPGSGRSARGEHGNPLQYSCLENPMDRGTTNTFTFPDSYSFHKSTANSWQSRGPHITDDSWTEHRNQGGLETGQPTAVIGSLITPRPTAMVKLMVCSGCVLRLLILQMRKQPCWLCCKSHLASSQDD